LGSGGPALISLFTDAYGLDLGEPAGFDIAVALDASEASYLKAISVPPSYLAA
jgi:hypothetical protein